MGRAVVFGILLILLGIGYFLFNRQEEQGDAVRDYRNAEYTIEGQPVTLSGNTRYFGNEMKGDFNGDGLEDVSFIITRDEGGSGTFFYVVVALNSADNYTGTNAIFLGDRIAPQTTEFRDGLIIVNYADRKPDEPMTARPSQGVSKYLKVVNSVLVESQSIR